MGKFLSFCNSSSICISLFLTLPKLPLASLNSLYMRYSVSNFLWFVSRRNLIAFFMPSCWYNCPHFNLHSIKFLLDFSLQSLKYDVKAAMVTSSGIFKSCFIFFFLAAFLLFLRASINSRLRESHISLRIVMRTLFIKATNLPRV